jgi:hypothetical protein
MHELIDGARAAPQHRRHLLNREVLRHARGERCRHELKPGR